MHDEEKHPFWQSLIDSAYDKWQKHDKELRLLLDNEGEGNWSYEEFLENCSELERKAVMLGNLNYQVHNGGFQQWVDNGYASSTLQHLTELFREEFETPTTHQVYVMLRKLEPYVNFKENKGFGSQYWNTTVLTKSDYYYNEETDENEENEEEEEYCAGWEVAHQLDNKYYELSDQLEIEIEEFLKTFAEKEQAREELLNSQAHAEAVISELHQKF